MPVPASINDLSTTAGSNSPPGSESPATIDDYLRTLSAFIAQLRNVSGLGAAAGQFLAFSAANTASLRSILGTVSQSGGVPTGAIVERGSSAAGEYVKFADGTMICTRDGFGANTTTTAAGAVFINTTDVVWTFPVPFVARPVGSATPLGNFRWAGVTNTTTNMTIRQYCPASSATSVEVQAYAIGRWF